MPSPDTYYKDQQRSVNKTSSNLLSALSDQNVIKGAAYNAPNNSQHHFCGVTSFKRTTDRFDKLKDTKDSMKPAPTSYQPSDYHRKRTIGQYPGREVRLSDNFYRTDAPGPGSYRQQSDFGIYCPEDTFGHLSSDLLTKIASQKILATSTKHQLSTMSGS